MPSRPIALVTAATLTAATGFGFAVGGLLLLALASGQLPFLDSVRATGVLVAMGVAALVAAGLAWVAAVDLWRGHALGWAASLVVGIVALDGALTAVLTSSVQAPLLGGLAMTVATVVALLATPTRAAVGLAQSGAAAA